VWAADSADMLPAATVAAVTDKRLDERNNNEQAPGPIGRGACLYFHPQHDSIK
jgi:hypothetical protein